MGLFERLSLKVAPNISFVCTGNICRSAYADLLLKSEVTKNQLPLTVDSAGTHALVGHDIDQTLREVAQEEGIYQTHSAQLLTEELISQKFGYILVMTEKHRDRVLSLHPAASKRTFLLAEFAAICRRINEQTQGQELYFKDLSELFLQEQRRLAPEDIYDVADPYGLPEEVHRGAAKEIRSRVEEIVDLFQRVNY